MNVRLDTYLDIERVMIVLDDTSDPMADTLRDALDSIWNALSEEDRNLLNRRNIVVG